MFCPHMSDEINSIPHIPDGLREAAQRRTLTFVMATAVNLSAVAC